MQIPLITPILDLIAKLGGKWGDLKIVEAEGRIAIAATAAKAEATKLVKMAEHQGAWEVAQVEASKTSWKDEWWTIILSLPLIAIFIPVPGLQGHIINAFHALQYVPEWYMWAVGAAISAAFGIRTGIFENIKTGVANVIAPKVPVK